MAGIYFHIPFCKRICAYCDFFRSADLRYITPLIDAMHRELESRADYLHDRTIHTLYFGGGTPSLLPPEALQALIDHAHSIFGFASLDEITVECNPDDLTDDYIDRLRDTQIDRLSIGIQSFDDVCLRLMNRRHTAAQAIDAVRRAQRAGFDNITIDLIFGIDGFGGKILQQTLETALSLNVQHISAYHLTVEPNTQLGRLTARGEYTPVPEQVSEQEFAAVHRTLTGGGFEHYEVSNFARQGLRARHNTSYWTGDEYLGIGPGAHSFDRQERRWCDCSVLAYIAEPSYRSERLTQRDRCNEYVMTSLRRAEGLNLDQVEQQFGAAHSARILHDAQPSLTRGTLLVEDRRLRIPAEKMLLSDAVICNLFDA